MPEPDLSLPPAAGLAEAIPELYEDLRSLARRYLLAERPDHTLQPTALVHEAYLRLADQRQLNWGNRSQVLGVAAQMMRRILVNYAEARNAGKREAQTHAIALEQVLDIVGRDQIDILTLEGALGKLRAFDPQQERVVELRYFGGLTAEEAAEVLCVSVSTVNREWSMARAWLRRELAGT